MNNPEYTSQLYRATANKMVADDLVNGSTMQKLNKATKSALDWLDNGGRRYGKDGRFTVTQSFDISSDARYVKLIATVEGTSSVDIKLKELVHKHDEGFNRRYIASDSKQILFL